MKTMKSLKFYKENDGRWYVDLPEWTGSKADLEMVCGADILLDKLSNQGIEVVCQISEIPVENFDLLEFVREAYERQNGAFYQLTSILGQNLNLEVWLCDVTRFVFGYFPRKIYLSVAA